MCDMINKESTTACGQFCILDIWTNLGNKAVNQCDVISLSGHFRLICYIANYLVNTRGN